MCLIFLFQTNTFGVIFHIVLSFPISLIAVNGAPVSECDNKVLALYRTLITKACRVQMDAISFFLWIFRILLKPQTVKYRHWKGKSTVLLAKVINPSCPTVDIINVMTSYPFNPKCCVLARFIAVNLFSRLSNMVKWFPFCFMGQVCI